MLYMVQGRKEMHMGEIKETLSQEEIEYLKKLDKAHTAKVRANMVTYPLPEDFESIDSEELERLGFSGKEDA